MGWAARANKTVRDGQRPARMKPEARRTVQPLAVFTPTATPLLDKDGQPRKGPDGKPLMLYGFRANAAPGAALSDTHYFDGHSVRRIAAADRANANQ